MIKKMQFSAIYLFFCHGHANKCNMTKDKLDGQTFWYFAKC